jgi:hypothetical protein
MTVSSSISGTTPLAVSAVDASGELVLSGVKDWGSQWTTKLMMDGHYIGTIHDNQPDGTWSFHTALPAAGTHTIEVYLNDTGTAAIDSITIPPVMSHPITTGFDYTSDPSRAPVPISGEMLNAHRAKIFVADAKQGTVWEQTFRETTLNGKVLSDVAFGTWQPVKLDGSFTAPIPDGGAGHAGPGGTHVADFVKVVTFPGVGPTVGLTMDIYSTWLAHG